MRVHRGGIVDRLEGRTVGGDRWPAGWRVEASQLARVPPAPYPVVLTPQESLDALRRWLGLAPGAAPAATARPQAFPPAPLHERPETGEIDADALPPDLATLLDATDGVVLGDDRLLHGAADVHLADLDGEPYWVVGTHDGAPLVLAAASGDPALLRWPHDARTRSDARVIAPGLRGYVRRLVFGGA